MTPRKVASKIALQKPPNSEDWAPPESDGLGFKFSVGDSILAEFVLGHDPAAVLRELIQNEYDARGRRLELFFQRDFLQISGTGKPIDTSGWKRLSVMLGTGHVDGKAGRIEPKSNGIGSKNLGLRSLFLYGDEIYIRSNGRQTVLDRLKGALPQPVHDPTSLNRLGVQINVPYRTAKLGSFQPFGSEQEDEALSSFVDEITPTMMKLAQHNTVRSLNELIVSSERCERRIVWKQSMEQLRCRYPGIKVLKRTVRVSDTRTTRPQILEEVEWQKVYSIPPEFSDQTIPGYFKVPGGRVRLSLSLRTRRGKVDLDQPGRFFYPIGAGHNFTGTAISINAPFQMDADRSQLVDPKTSPWNKWLLQTAADLAFDLAVSDWPERVGPLAVLALQKRNESTTPLFLTLLDARLKEEACWPTRARSPGEKSRPVFVAAKSVVLPDHPDLDGFLADENYLDKEAAAEPAVRDLAKIYGAKAFSLNSLVRLRCAGKDVTTLKTRVGADADFVFYNFPKALEREEIQIQFARALDSLSKHLSGPNREDLKTSATTLSAGGGLKAPLAPLWVVDSVLLNVCPVPVSDRLYSALTSFKVLRGFCKEFDPNVWAQEVAKKVQGGIASDEERIALYKYILSPRRRLSRATVTVLRQSPVLRDHHGDWVMPSSITVEQAAGVSHFRLALHFPHPDYAQDTELGRTFRFRRKIDGDDLVTYAQIVATQPNLAANFEDLLHRYSRLMTPKVVQKLRGIAFLRTSQETAARPTETYLRNPLNQACLGKLTPFVLGSRVSLYERLGCMESPRVADILTHLVDLQASGAGPERPEVLYNTLVDGLKRARLSLTTYQEQPILWIGNGYSCPEATLLGLNHRKTFFQAVPQASQLSHVLHMAYLALGAHSHPTSAHWRQLLLWLSDKYKQVGGPVTPQERNSLREAYGCLDELPAGIAGDTKVLLDSEGMLHSQSDVSTGRYVINDEPKLAQILVDGHVPIAFADTANAKALSFFTGLGIHKLTDVRQELGTDIGELREPPKWIDCNKMLGKIQSADFRSALMALAAHHYHGNTHKSLDLEAADSQLIALQQICFAEKLNTKVRVINAIAVVPADACLQGSRIVLTSVRSHSELNGLLSQVIATLYIQQALEQRVFEDSIFRLLASETPQDMQRYLNNHGIPWRPTYEGTTDETGGEENEPIADDARLLSELLVGDLNLGLGGNKSRREDQPMQPETKPDKAEMPDTKPPRPSLPPLEAVEARHLEPLDTWVPPGPREGGARRPGSWLPPSRRDQERDQAVGSRGEEIIYRRELARVQALGYAETRVIWQSRSDPGAPYDILSLDDDGEDLWIEVKSTTGRDGRFQWSKGEFEKALQERERYVLWRVYEADTSIPAVKSFRDPISILLRRAMSLNVADFNAEVEPLSPGA